VGVPASAAPGADPVALAQEAERLGFDFVSLPDHPCGPDPSYEATVLLTWIAARTARIKVASRVLAAPFRRPAMLAKLAASLDLLSGGRLVLGLGGGYSDSEITALGSPALSPAQKVDGLAETIQIIRGAWTQPGYSQDGRYYSVRALRMEPRPSSPIPVWTGAFGPRALAVTGRLADGWIPSLGYMPTEDIPAMRHRIDAAAEAAGRRPQDIRGILNLGIRIDPGASSQSDLVTGTVPQILGQLHGLLDLGFTGFSFMPLGQDRRAGMQEIAEEIIPALRS
jgi:alkanesulfonate monooxygenase SsuD/methylene tetrahydromethanopterin reductase-like flavin-dependent oxidoreductase (luciferase family)